MKHQIHPQLEALAIPIADLYLDQRNARKHADRDLRTIAHSLERFGQRKPIVVQRDGMIVRAGNGTVLAARTLGWTHIAAVVCDDTDDVATRYGLVDNRSAELSEWDTDVLPQLLSEIGLEDAEAFGWNRRDLDAMASKFLEDVGDAPRIELDSEEAAESEDEEDERDDAPDLDAPDPITRPGDLWLLGRHRVICGSCMDPATVRRVLDGVDPDAMLTDPPYCSGGYREADRHVGSVGRRDKSHAKIKNDRLSTRGYQALMAQALQLFGAPIPYVFTDWRMWSWLYDVVERSGYGVRGMLVWDKMQPGLGRGWRAQHELILFASAHSVDFDPALSHGNVIQCKRTRNKLHPTEKPVDLLRHILAVNGDNVTTVADAFLGSGSTLMACEEMGRTCLGTELEPVHVDTIVRRWEAATGRKAERIAAVA